MGGQLPQSCGHVLQFSPLLQLLSPQYCPGGGAQTPQSPGHEEQVSPPAQVPFPQHAVMAQGTVSVPPQLLVLVFVPATPQVFALVHVEKAVQLQLGEPQEPIEQSVHELTQDPPE